GVCAAGTQTCTGGSVQCVRNTAPSAEICDNLDNDCNGVVDNFATACGVGGCASSGVCVAGVDSCVAGSPVAEACDNVDNDCDGMVDEGNPGGGVACSTGLQGVCAVGLTACVSGSTACIQQIAASTETCDGLDNDCNGAVDGFATACGVGRCAANGTCNAGVDTCTPAASTAEVCNGLDDDCDGTVDDVAGGCTLFVTDPIGAQVLDCTAPLISQPTIVWSAAQYDSFKVYISTAASFPSTKRITSGK